MICSPDTFERPRAFLTYQGDDMRVSVFLNHAFTVARLCGQSQKFYLRSRSLRFYSTTTMTAEIDSFYNAVLNVTKQAGQVIQNKVLLNKKVETKSGEIDLVTETDQEVEKLLMDTLGKQFPDHKFIGEETVGSGGQCNLTSAPTWIIDPIDGTMNFVHSFPHSCISIALFIEFEPVIAVIYNPMIGQLFTAQKGKGAFLNGKKIQVSGETDLNKSLIMVEIGSSRDAEKLKVLKENYQTLLEQVHGMRSLGSAALDMAMVALGCADAYFEFGIHIWDIAAGELIVTEAGGVVVDPSGGPLDRLSRRVLCAASLPLAEQMSQKLVQFYPTPRD